MPMVIPIQKLEDTSYVASVCREAMEPIFISENGAENMVLMSMDQYRRNLARMEIYSKIEEAETAIAAGDEMDAFEHLASLKDRCHA